MTNWKKRGKRGKKKCYRIVKIILSKMRVTFQTTGSGAR